MATDAVSSGNILSQGASRTGPLAVFVNPPDIHSRIFPLGLSQILSIAKRHGFQVSLLDLNNQCGSEDLLRRTITTIADAGPEMLCVTGFSINRRFLSDLTTAVEARSPNTLIVGGGYWCRWSPEFAIKHTACDVIVKDEGDVPFDGLCACLWQDLPYEDVPGLAIRSTDGVVDTGPADLVRDLSELPEPEWDVFQYSRNYVWNDGDDVCASLQTGRGCIGRCIFCTGARQRFRKYPIERIIAEVKHVKSAYGVNMVRFKEALTFVRNQWSRDLLRRFIDADLGIRFEAICRIDSIDRELVDLLERAGCCSIQFGIEVADDFMLQSVMHKNITVRQIRHAIDLCHRAGILPSGGFLLGLPNETVGSLMRTTIFALTNRVSATGVTFPVPFPGTELYEIAKRRFGLSDEDILLNPRLGGYDQFCSGYGNSLAYLAEFKFCDLSPHVLIFFHRVISNILAVNNFLLKRDFRGLLRMFLKLIGKAASLFCPFRRRIALKSPDAPPCDAPDIPAMLPGASLIGGEESNEPTRPRHT